MDPFSTPPKCGQKSEGGRDQFSSDMTLVKSSSFDSCVSQSTFKPKKYLQKKSVKDFGNQVQKSRKFKKFIVSFIVAYATSKKRQNIFDY